MWLPANIRGIAKEWTDGLFTDLEWKKDESRVLGQGEAQGFLATAEGFPHRAYLKPTVKCEEHHPRAAYEKIASDLASEIGLPVSPVQLFRRPNCPDGQEARTCVSLVLFPEQQPWGEVQNHPMALALSQPALARACGIVAFDVYLGNSDRNNANNAIFGIDPRSPLEATFIFLDFANSLNQGNQWDKQAWQQIAVPGIFGPMDTAVSLDVLRASLNRIEALPDAIIERIVTRIPDDYMTPAHRDIVKEGLLGRRSLVRQALRTKFPGLEEPNVSTE